MGKDYYKTLGVEKNATPEEIKKAFRQKAHQHHPDKAGGDEAKFKEINEAYQVLSDSKKRSQYDQFGSNFQQGGAGFSGGGFDGMNINMDEITDSHELKDVDLVVLKGAFGVAENAAIWIPSNTLQYRVLPFITQHLVIVLDKSDIVLNMHQAYQKLDIQSTNGFGVFISGPSKTADIEQSLVIGAHGSRSLFVVLV